MIDKVKELTTKIFNGVKKNQHSISLVIGYLLIAVLFFNLGSLSTVSRPPEIKIEEPSIDLNQLNSTPNSPALQPTTRGGEVAGEQSDQNCLGKIKGNISSSGKIYHVPGGSFYNRTNPEICFDTETEALQAGFRKSQR